MSKTTIAVAALAAALALGTAIPAPATQAPAAPQLWRVVTDAGEAPQRGVLHSREVRTDDFRLREFTAPGDRLRLSMEPGTNLEVELVRVTSDPLNGYVWSGRVVGAASFRHRGAGRWRIGTRIPIDPTRPCPYD